ncbi:MAG: ATP-binding protein, partial [Candidatus Berkiella sp.]
MYIKRTCEPTLFTSFERPYVSALLGPRRVGKTTIVNHYQQLHPTRTWVALNMDKLGQRQRIAKEELPLMIEEGARKPLGKEKIWVVVDEAQKCPELFEQIKIIYDEYKGNDKIKFILTGSAHLDLHNLTTESLAGRVELLNLREFNLREIACNAYPNDSIPSETAFDIIFNQVDDKLLQQYYHTLRPFNKIFTNSLQTHLIWGGLPEVLQENAQEYRLKYLGDYLQTYLDKDVRAIESISDLALYHNLMKICAELTGSVRDDKKIIEALHCARNTLNKYRGYLQATLQYIEIYPYINSSLKRLVKSPKGYLTNNGLVSYFSGITDLSILNSTGLIGHRFENWFLNELLTWQASVPEHHETYYWRTATGLEVDFIVQ